MRLRGLPSPKYGFVRLHRETPPPRLRANARDLSARSGALFVRVQEYCLVMPLAIGGDLAFHLINEGNFEKKRTLVRSRARIPPPPPPHPRTLCYDFSLSGHSQGTKEHSIRRTETFLTSFESPRPNYNPT